MSKLSLSNNSKLGSGKASVEEEEKREDDENLIEEPIEVIAPI